MGQDTLPRLQYFLRPQYRLPAALTDWNALTRMSRIQICFLILAALQKPNTLPLFPLSLQNPSQVSSFHCSFPSIRGIVRDCIQCWIQIGLVWKDSSSQIWNLLRELFTTSHCEYVTFILLVSLFWFMKWTLSSLPTLQHLMVHEKS